MNRTVSIDWLQTGLVGTIGYEVRGLDDAVLQPHTTAGITESPAGSGIYVVSIPDTWSGRVLFDANGETFDEPFFALSAGAGAGGTTLPVGTVTVFKNIFEYIPVISKETEVIIRFAAIRNLSTVSGTGSTDRGRMFGTVASAGGVTTVSLYSDAARTQVIATGTGAVGAWIELASGPQGVHGETARAFIEAFPGAGDRSAKFVCFPSFADDADVYPDPNYVSALPGYDTGADGGSNTALARGLAIFHAAAVKQLLTTSLPAAIPHLFGGNGLAALVPMDESEIAFPDIRKIANVDSLREAQAQLVLSMAAGKNRHLREFADISDAARDRFNELIEEIRTANEPADTDEADSENAEPGRGGISFGSFTRN